MSDLPSSVLFCCTMNAIRSPMAAALMRHFHGRKVYVDSAGVRPDDCDADGFMIAVMDELGIDMSDHQPKSFDQLEDDSFDLIVTMSPEAQHKAIDYMRHAHCDIEFWNTFDPSLVDGTREQRLDAYRKVRDQIVQRIKTRFPLMSMSHI